MNKIVLVILILSCLVIISCEKQQEIEKSENVKYRDALDNLFLGCPKMNLDSKYFDVRFIHSSGKVLGFLSDFKTELFHPRIIIKYWIRSYNMNNKYYKEIRYYNDDVSTENLIIISNSYMAAFIKWKNLKPEIESNFWTNDLGNKTIYVSTNLPESIVRKYYPSLGCNIMEVHPSTISVDLAKLHPNYQYVRKKILDSLMNVWEQEIVGNSKSKKTSHTE